MFWKMPLIAGIGDEVTQFFVALFTIAVLYFAWRSTNVREDSRLQRTAVLIIENNRRRLNNQRIAQHPVTISTLRNSSRQLRNTRTPEQLGIEDSSADIASEVHENIATLDTPPNLLSVLDEISNLNTSQLTPSRNLVDAVESPEQLIQEMDSVEANSDGLRQRRGQFYRRSSNETVEELIDLPENDSETSNTDNCSNENNENINITRVMTEAPKKDTEQPLPPSQSFTKESLNTSQPPFAPPDTGDDEMRIKLKYLNDDLKIVNAQPDEALGEFTKRNFSVELAAQKFVRLVFNGHVLQPETKTLKACGLFDNCVVHCLVHNRKPQSRGQDGSANRQGDDMDDLTNIGINQGTRERSADNGGPLLIYFGMCLISLVLVCGWYCRFRYNYLFSWYSTTGLILMTALFLIMIPLNVLLEREASG